eukprot:gene10360-10427_t
MARDPVAFFQKLPIFGNFLPFNKDLCFTIAGRAITMRDVAMKRIVPALMMLTLGACGTDPHKAFADGRAAYDHHDFRTARVALATALDKDPANRQARELLIRSLLALGDGEAAKAALDRLAINERPADYANLIGEAALLRDDPDGALRAVDGRNDGGAMRIRALALLARSDTGGAALAFAKGAEVQPADPRLLADYARWKLGNDDRAGARTLIDQAQGLARESIDVLLTAGQIATAEGRLADAAALYDKAHRLWPDSLAAVTGEAAALGDLGQIAAMQKLLDANSAAAGHNLEFAYLQARGAAARGDWTSAHAILQGHEGELDSLVSAGVLYAQSLDRLGQHEQARARLAPIVARHGDVAAARRLLAAIQLQQGDAKGALTTLAPLIASPTATLADRQLAASAAKAAGTVDAEKLGLAARFPAPQALAAQLANADTAMRQGNWANAAAIYTQLLGETDGKNPLLLNNLANAESQLGQKDNALGHALKALDAAPGNASVMDTAGWLMVETGKDPARGRKLLADAAAKAPGNATIAAHLRTASR